MNNGGFTVGTVLVGLAMIVWELAVWYPGRKALMKKPVPWLGQLLPFAILWCTGALMAMCLGGLVGYATDWFIWGTGWLGDAALVWGVGGQRQAAPQSGVSQALTTGGLVMTLLLMTGVLARLGKGFSASKKRGLVSGITLSLSAGVAAFVAVPLASAANLSGIWLTAVVPG